MPYVSVLRSELACLGIILALAAGCQKPASHPTAALRQRGYLWQRNWDASVGAAAAEAGRRLDGVVFLGAEIGWRQDHPDVIKANIPWEAFRGKAVSLGLRVAPFPGPFVTADERAQSVAGTAKSLVEEATSHGVALSEFQLDFDCAQKKLAGYRLWVRAVRSAIAPVPLVITALPGWLDEKDFPSLVREADGYVLQVHSVPLQSGDRRKTLCDPRSARRWVARAARLGLPFSIALPTYRCLAGYAPDGKLLGVAMDSVRLAWPPGTRVLEFASDADELAELVRELRETRPAGLKELIWYRVPVAADVRNWRWPTLAAVMEGRKPTRKLEVVHTSGNPVDFTIVNAGESDEPLGCEVKVTWEGAQATASDSLAGWDLKIGGGEAVFDPAPGVVMRLPPGERRDIGWIRYDRIPSVRAQAVPDKAGAAR